MVLPPPPPNAHFEYVMEQKDMSGQMRAKKMALNVMNSLEGWCSKNKASILMDLVFMFKPKVAVEIGVWGGKSLIPIAFALRENGFGVIHGIDPWMAKASIEGMEGANKEWWGSVDHGKVLKGLRKKVDSLSLNDCVKLIRKTSADATPIEKIDLLHIDGNHSEEASLLDVNKWVPLVSPGGIIILDDTTWNGENAAVSYLNKHCLKLVEYKGGNTWGVWLNVPPSSQSN